MSTNKYRGETKTTTELKDLLPQSAQHPARRHDAGGSVRTGFGIASPGGASPA
jgi:hypothetical protein